MLDTRMREANTSTTRRYLQTILDTVCTTHGMTCPAPAPSAASGSVSGSSPEPDPEPLSVPVSSSEPEVTARSATAAFWSPAGINLEGAGSASDAGAARFADVARLEGGAETVPKG